jgi:hypothetical protein
VVASTSIIGAVASKQCLVAYTVPRAAAAQEQVIISYIRFGVGFTALSSLQTKGARHEQPHLVGRGDRYCSVHIRILWVQPVEATNLRSRTIGGRELASPVDGEVDERVAGSSTRSSSAGETRLPSGTESERDTQRAIDALCKGGV